MLRTKFAKQNREPGSLRSTRDWVTLVLWTGITTIGWGFGIISTMSLYSHVVSGGDTLVVVAGFPASIASALVGAIVLAPGQAWVLGRRFAVAPFWDLATLFGMLVGGGILGMTALPVMIALGVARASGAAWVGSAVILGCLFGGMLGLAQWLVLRQTVPRAYWWVGSSTAAWGAGAGLYWAGYWVLTGRASLTFSPSREADWFSIIVAWIIGGLVIGASSGLTVERLFGQLRTAPLSIPIAPLRRSGRVTMGEWEPERTLNNPNETESRDALASSPLMRHWPEEENDRWTESRVVNPEGSKPVVRDSVTALVIEILAGLVGFLGVGHIVAGRLASGFSLMLGWFAAAVVIWLMIGPSNWIAPLLWATGPVSSGLWLAWHISQPAHDSTDR